MLVDGVSSGFCIQACPQGVGAGNVLRCILLESTTPSIGGIGDSLGSLIPVATRLCVWFSGAHSLPWTFCLNPRYSKRLNPGVASRIRSCR